MKKNYKLITGFIVLLSLMTMKLGAQCISSSQYPSGVVNISAALNANTTISGCQYSEYAVVQVNAAGVYVITNSNVGDWVTVANNATGTTIFGTGQCPYTITLTATGTYYLHFSTAGAPNCTFASGGCRTTAMQFLGAPCVGVMPSPTVTAASATLCRKLVVICRSKVCLW